MGYAVEFEGANGVLGVHESQQHAVSPLHVYRNGVCCVSCWELTDEEIAEIVRTKRVFLSVMFGRTQPPVFVGSETTVREMNADYGVWPRTG